MRNLCNTLLCCETCHISGRCESGTYIDTLEGVSGIGGCRSGILDVVGSALDHSLGCQE